MRKKPLFTGGKWRKDKYGTLLDRHGESILLRGVALYGNGPDEQKREAEANTQLLFAAPKMYHAIKNYLEWGPMTDSDRDLCVDLLRSAIALADKEYK